MWWWKKEKQVTVEDKIKEFEDEIVAFAQGGGVIPSPNFEMFSEALLEQFSKFAKTEKAFYSLWKIVFTQIKQSCETDKEFNDKVAQVVKAMQNVKKGV